MKANTFVEYVKSMLLGIGHLGGKITVHAQHIQKDSLLNDGYMAKWDKSEFAWQL